MSKTTAEPVKITGPWSSRFGWWFIENLHYFAGQQPFWLVWMTIGTFVIGANLYQMQGNALGLLILSTIWLMWFLIAARGRYTLRILVAIVLIMHTFYRF